MSEALEVIGSLAAATSASAAIMTADRRLRAGAMTAALALAAALVVGQAWNGELASLREEPARLALLVAVAAAVLAGLAAVFVRVPSLAPLALLAALPFRVPVETNGEDANLLLPLYLILGAAVAAEGWRAARDPGRVDPPGPAPLRWALAAGLLLYAAQSAYSADVAFAARNVAFFLAPFAVAFVVLASSEWTPRLLGLAGAIVVGEALLFAAIGIWQHEAGETFWNPSLETSNDFHLYFRVNSLFWDANIYGRYLALAVVVATAWALWSRGLRATLLLGGAIAAIWLGLVFGFSQTSFAALLVGLAVLAALRWSLRWTLVAAPLATAALVVAITLAGGEAEDSAREITSGRSTLVKGGLELARERPLLGHGSASFSQAFGEAEDVPEGKTTISHNEPVTVAAEQGALGILAYAALLLLALWALSRGMRAIAPGLGAPLRELGGSEGGGAAAVALARMTILAAFCALLVHTVGYAGYLTDPLTWALLAIGVALAPRGRGRA